MFKKTLLCTATFAVMIASTGMTSLAARSDLLEAQRQKQVASYEAVMEIPTSTKDTTADNMEADEDGMYDVAVLGSTQEAGDTDSPAPEIEKAKARNTGMDEEETTTVNKETSATVVRTEENDAAAEIPQDTEEIPAEEQQAQTEIVEEQTSEAEETPENPIEEQVQAEAPAPAEEAPAPAPANPGIDLPGDVQAWCEQAAAEFGLDKNVLEGLVWVESKGNVGARNGSYIGLTQLNPRNFGAAMSALGIADPAEALSNLRICAYSLTGWIGKYGNMHIALDSWHRGEGRAAASHKAEGTSYTRKIMEKASQYAGASN